MKIGGTEKEITNMNVVKPFYGNNVSRPTMHFKNQEKKEIVQETIMNNYSSEDDIDVYHEHMIVTERNSITQKKVLVSKGLKSSRSSKSLLNYTY